LAERSDSGPMLRGAWTRVLHQGLEETQGGGDGGSTREPHSGGAKKSATPESWRGRTSFPARQVRLGNLGKD